MVASSITIHGNRCQTSHPLIEQVFENVSVDPLGKPHDVLVIYIGVREVKV